MLEEIRICLFFKVDAVGFSPVTLLEEGENVEEAPGCVIRCLNNGAHLTIPVSGGPEEVAGSQQRIFGNGDDIDQHWKIEVSTEYVAKGDAATLETFWGQGYLEVKRETDDLDFLHWKECVKMMRYSLGRYG